MFGMNCRECGRRPGGAYLTAYQIALKHGFKGTEEQWIRSIGTMRSIHVTEESGGTFECDASLGQVLQMMEDGFIPVLITVEGLPAFLSDVTGEVLSFSTSLIRDIEGDYYACYSMSGREYTVQKMTVTGSEGGGGSIGPGSITYSMLHANVRAALDKADSAYQKPTEGIPDTDMTEEVQASLALADSAYQLRGSGIPYDDLTPQVQGYLDLARSAAQEEDLRGLVRMDRQGTKTAAQTQRVVVDSEGALWVLPQGDGESSEAVEETEFITMTDTGELTVNKTPMQIYTVLSEGAKQILLTDYAGRQCAMIVPPRYNNGGYTDMVFWTFGDLDQNIILYTINSAGVVQMDTISLNALYALPTGGIPETDLAAAVQASLALADSAIQSHQSLTGLVPRNQQAIKTVDHTQEVTIDANGKLWVLAASSGGGSSNTELVTMTASGNDLTASKTSAQIYTILSGGAKNIVMIDYAGRQCVLIKKPTYSSNAYTDAIFLTFDETNANLVFYTVNSAAAVSDSTLPVTGFYTKPSGGIPYTDLAGDIPATKLASAVQSALLTKILTMTQSGSTYTYYGANFSFTSLDDLISIIQSGSIVWLMNQTTGSVYRGVNIRDASGTGRVTFAGVTQESDSDDPVVEVFIINDSMNITKKVLKKLPAASSSDSGKIVQVNSSGEYELGAAPSGSYSGPTISVPTSADDGKLLIGNADGSTSWAGRETIQLVPDQIGAVSIQGDYQTLTKKLTRPNPARVITATQATTLQNLEGVELHPTWFNDTENKIHLVGNYADSEYFITLTQSGTASNRVMSGIVSIRHLGTADATRTITPTAINQTEYSFSMADNCIYKVPSNNTKVTITSVPSTGMAVVIFTTPSTIPTEYFTKPSLMKMPADWAGVQPSTRYEINVLDGYALVDARAVS